MVEIAKWFGLRNTSAPERGKPGELRGATNVDIDDSYTIRVRRGKTNVDDTAAHSMWASGDMCFVMHGAVLKRMNAGGQFTTLRTLSTSDPVSYAEDNGVIYFTNGTDTGRIVRGEAREWGIRVPTSHPNAAYYGLGTLPPGTYQYAVTFVRRDGLESGCRHPTTITLTERGGITFTNLPTSSDPEVSWRNLYVSGPNGTELFRVAALGWPQTSFIHMGGVEDGPVLDPDFVTPAPSGTEVAIHNGVAFVVDGSTVWASDLFSLEKFRHHSRFVQFPGKVTLFAPVSDGVYAATDQETWFLGGNGPGFQWRSLGKFGAVPGTSARFVTSALVADGEPPGPQVQAVVWMSQNGVIMGFPGGQAKSLTEGKYNFPSAARGMGLVRSARGYTSYVVTTIGTADNANSY